MAAMRQVLFVQGGGAGTYDEWDGRLVDSLRRELGDGWEVRYPRMPGEDDPDPAAWSAAIRGEMTLMDDGVVVVGHSVGGTILAGMIGDGTMGGSGPIGDATMGGSGPIGDATMGGSRPVGDGGTVGVGVPERRLGGIVLIAAPFVEGPELPPDVPVHVFHGLADETIPPGHAEAYGKAIPHAGVSLLPDRDHQLGDDLSEVARVISGW
ncbi:alpha/beta hydrolase [Actinoplanes utahensis]|uniref:Alpha/beta hydrolase n=1 Tax=Actinoplanes utahensis TaxID=1869 RepID=A0A0A6UN58_ACTUT|nr:alpha/beta hydrolase [Actinoplanes utahensis]KHD75749.1 hypothetical protein MB27_21280 [Actinoplanes utahensis]GIF34496.1 hypothetical protein Aut01nite_74820 [Actinoplanes utahensis]